MNANLTKMTIELTKTEAKAAGILNTTEYSELMSLKASYPTFQIVIVKTATKKTDHFKGLTYAYMETYIKAHNKELLAEFFTLCGKDAKGDKVELAARATYGEIKMWFLTQFPDIEAMAKNIENIMKETRKTRAAKRAA